MTLSFTPQRVRELRQRSGTIHATLVPLSEQVVEGRVRRFYREFVIHDEDQRPVGKKKELVNDVDLHGALRPAKVTIHLVEVCAVYDKESSKGIRTLDLTAARACGFKTVLDLQIDWRAHHPHAALAKLVWFSIGDIRDRDRFLRRYISCGGDYVSCYASDVIDNLPALSPEELQELATHSLQRDTKRRATVAQDLASESLADRAARIESLHPRLLQEIRNELKIMTDRCNRAIHQLRKGGRTHGQQ